VKDRHRTASIRNAVFLFVRGAEAGAGSKHCYLTKRFGALASICRENRQIHGKFKEGVASKG
jgi:hypothetical protein